MHVGASAEIGCRRDGRYHRGLGVHGDIDIIPPGTPSRWELGGTDTALILAVPQNLLALAAEESRADPGSIQIVNRFQIRDPQIERIGWALKAETEAGYPGGQIYFDSLAFGLSTALVKRHSSLMEAAAGEAARYTYGMPGRTLRRVLGYIEDNLSRDLSLKEIADVAGLSVSHCKTAFHKSVGSPIHQYVIQRRVERAKQLLAKEGLSIGEVAAAAGFTHKSHLAFHTRRVFGLSPSGLRRRISGS
jgi:AraC family transcriptional regulator